MHTCHISLRTQKSFLEGVIPTCPNSLQKAGSKKVEHEKKLDVKEQQSLKHNVQPVKQHTYESKDKKDQSIHANKAN